LRTSKANGFALAENGFSQWHHGHGAQADAVSKANGFALAENGFSQWHHSHGEQADAVNKAKGEWRESVKTPAVN